MNVFTFGASRDGAYLIQDRIGSLIEIGQLVLRVHIQRGHLLE